jgi:hypothetical protein
MILVTDGLGYMVPTFLMQDGDRFLALPTFLSTIGMEFFSISVSEWSYGQGIHWILTPAIILCLITTHTVEELRTEM